MKSSHLVGTSIPRFRYDTPLVPANDFYALCDDPRPLALVFLPDFLNPISRDFITRYVKTLSRLQEGRVACVVRSNPHVVSEQMHGTDFPFPILCDAVGVLYAYFNIERTTNPLSWSFIARRIYKAAKEQGYPYDRNTPQILPLTLVVGKGGKILFAHYGRSITDMPEDCIAINDLCRSLLAELEPDSKKEDPMFHTDSLLSDETGALPDLKLHEEEEEAPEEDDAISRLFL